MKRNIIIGNLMLLLVLSISSCKKFLVQEPVNRIPVSEIFKDFEGARTTAVGLYEQLRSFDYYLRDFYIYADLAGGNIKYARATNQLLIRNYNFDNNEIENDMRSFYERAYSIIYGANNILENISNVRDANPQQINRLVADAYAIRALVHFDLVRIFAQPYNFTADGSHPGIILRTETGDVKVNPGARATVAQVYTQIFRDMDSALNRYSNSTQIYAAGNEKTYLRTDAVKALLSRMHLYAGNWQEVIDNSTDVLSTGSYTILTNATYVNSWARKNISRESIFEIAFGNRPAGAIGDYFNPLITSNVQWAATTDLTNLFEGNDVRRPATLFVSATISSTPYLFTRKYLGTADSSNNIKVIRSSELHLNRAEAYAELDMLTEALADLNAIRRRANAAAPNIVSTDKQLILDEIMKERRRELCFEGHLLFDVVRRKQNLVRNDAPGLNPNINYPSPLFACPIPIVQ